MGRSLWVDVYLNKLILISVVMFFTICSKSWAEDGKIELAEKIGFHVAKVSQNFVVISEFIQVCKNDKLTKSYFEELHKHMGEYAGFIRYTLERAMFEMTSLADNEENSKTAELLFNKETEKVTIALKNKLIQ